MRWDRQLLDAVDRAALPGLESSHSVIRRFDTPDFREMAFLEVTARSALNRVPGNGFMGGALTINPYRGCQHACVYCFARDTHRYLDLDTGRDFDTQIVVKVNIAEVLAAELHAMNQRPTMVMLGTNTDPYQRAEGRYRLLPKIITTLTDFRCGISLLTKGSLLRRDLPLLAEAARSVPVEVAMSIAIFDEQLQQLLEPGTPGTAARLATVRAVRDAGLDCAVLATPVLPGLTDGIRHLDSAFARLAEAGATAVTAGALHLRPGAREWYLAWLQSERPELLPLYKRLYAKGAYPDRRYRDWLAARIDWVRSRHRLAPARQPRFRDRTAEPRPAMPKPAATERKPAIDTLF